MKLTWIGHACILLQTTQANVIADPWLSDPIFGGSIFHVPPRKHSTSDLPHLDVICITHAHFDHFHEETLQKLNKDAIIVIPRSRIRPLPEELKILGFKRIVELTHWKSFTYKDIKITAIPSVGVPEEIAFVFESEGHGVFHAADCYFEVIAEEIAKKFKLDIGFIPYCGWDHAGLLGFQPEKIWEPNYKELAAACRELGLRYVVPAASNAYWYPKDLKWFNTRVCPGKRESFMKALEEEPASPPIQPLALEPGDGWDMEKEEIIHTPLKPIPLPPESEFRPTWMVPELKIWKPDEVDRALRRYTRQRRNHLIKVLWSDPKSVLWLLKTRFEFASHYEGKPYVWHVDLCRWNPVKLTPHDPTVHFGISLLWEDLCAMVQGLVDTQDLTDSNRAKMFYLKESKDFSRAYGLEYVFFTRSLVRRRQLALNPD